MKKSNKQVKVTTTKAQSSMRDLTKSALAQIVGGNCPTQVNQH